MICRRGHITKTEIGAIRIAANETLFEVPRAAAGRFADALKRTEGDEAEGDGNVKIETAAGPPRVESRPNRSGPPQRHSKPAHKPKPYRR